MNSSQLTMKYKTIQLLMIIYLALFLCGCSGWIESALTNPKYYLIPERRRRRLIKQVSDQNTLEWVAMHDHSDIVKMLAVDRLTNQEALARIALNTRNNELRTWVLWKLNDQEALERIALGEIEPSLERGRYISSIPGRGGPISVREVARLRLRDPNRVKRVSKKIDPELKAIVIDTKKPIEERINAMGRIRDDEILLELLHFLKERPPYHISEHQKYLWDVCKIRLSLNHPVIIEKFGCTHVSANYHLAKQGYGNPPEWGPLAGSRLVVQEWVQLSIVGPDAKHSDGQYIKTGTGIPAWPPFVDQWEKTLHHPIKVYGILLSFLVETDFTEAQIEKLSLPEVPELHKAAIRSHEKRKLNLLCYWSFENLKGDTVLDSSPIFPVDGKLIGNANVVADAERGKVLKLDGEGDLMDCGTHESFITMFGMTISVWFKVNRFNKSSQALITKGRTFGLRRSGRTNNLEFFYLSTALKGKTNVNDGKWHHAVAVFSRNNLRLFIDGELQGERRLFRRMGWGGTSWYAGRILIGAYCDDYYKLCPNPKHEWNGLIDDVKIFGVTMRKEDVKALYLKEKANLI